MIVTRRRFIASSMALGAVTLVPGPGQAASGRRVEQWGVFELSLNGPRLDDAFDTVTFGAVFNNGTDSVRVPGFYDGDGVYRVRFSPPERGPWRWRTFTSTAALDGHSGEFLCTQPGAGNHGPVRVSDDSYHFVHADGTPFRPVGTTAYSWALQSDRKCAQTIETLYHSGFNKIRMLVFPNVDAAATDPFTTTGPGLRDWDATRPDPAYFRRYEQRIRQLLDIGVQADIILYHPYDETRGYSDMQRADDERYLRYVAARFGAYRNVWWSMANEYDAVESKSVKDWDHLFQVLRDADPHDRLRSIHQIKRYYGHRKPWITHASIQNGSAVMDDSRAQAYRNFAQKAVIFDEVCYEGNSTARWARLTGEELVQRFWWGTVAGTYVGHGETHESNRDPDYSWLGQGGELQGTSPPRLAFLRQILEQAPTPGIDPIDPMWDAHMGGQPFEYYLKYFGAERRQEWEAAIPGRRGDPENTYRADIIDTWNMTVTPVDGVFRMTPQDDYHFRDPSRPTLALPGQPYLAVRLVRVSS